jgi:hypothetical protein
MEDDHDLRSATAAVKSTTVEIRTPTESAGNTLLLALLYKIATPRTRNENAVPSL